MGEIKGNRHPFFGRWITKSSSALPGITIVILLAMLDFSEEIFGDPVRNYLIKSFTLEGTIAAGISLAVALVILFLSHYIGNRWMKRAAHGVLLLAFGIAFYFYTSDPTMNGVSPIQVGIIVALMFIPSLWLLLFRNRPSFRFLTWPPATYAIWIIILHMVFVPARCAAARAGPDHVPPLVAPIAPAKATPSPTAPIFVPPIVPTADTTATTEPTADSIPPTDQPEEPTAEPEATEKPSCTGLLNYPPPAGASHVVQEGESLASIALLYGTTIEALVAGNKKIYKSLEDEPNCILAGWILVIPDPEITPTPVATRVTP